MIEQPPLDFEKVEKLRISMMLTVTQFVSLFGVSRMTYYSWVRGKPIRKHNDARLRRALKQLLTVVKSQHWPTPESINMTSRERFAKLQQMMTV